MAVDIFLALKPSNHWINYFLLILFFSTYMLCLTIRNTLKHTPKASHCPLVNSGLEWGKLSLNLISVSTGRGTAGKGLSFWVLISSLKSLRFWRLVILETMKSRHWAWSRCSINYSKKMVYWKEKALKASCPKSFHSVICYKWKSECPTILRIQVKKCFFLKLKKI